MASILKYLICTIIAFNSPLNAEENIQVSAAFLSNSPIPPSSLLFDKSTSLKNIQFDEARIPYVILSGKLKEGLKLSVNRKVIPIDDNQNFELKVLLDKNDDACLIEIIEKSNKAYAFNFAYKWNEKKDLPFIRSKIIVSGKVKNVITKIENPLSLDEWIVLTWKEPTYIEEKKPTDWYRHARIGPLYALTKEGQSSASLLAGWSPKWQITETASIRAAILGSVLRYDANNLLYLADLRILGGYKLKGKYLLETGAGMQSWFNYGGLSQTFHFALSYLVSEQFKTQNFPLRWLSWLESVSLEDTLALQRSGLNHQLSLSLGIRF